MDPVEHLRRVHIRDCSCLGGWTYEDKDGGADADAYLSDLSILSVSSDTGERAQYAGGLVVSDFRSESSTKSGIGNGWEHNSPPNCRNGYGSVCEHNTSSIRLNLFSFVVIISYGFTGFPAHNIKSETLKLTRSQLTEVLWI